MRSGHGVVNGFKGYQRGYGKWLRIKAALREEEPKPKASRETSSDAGNSCGRQKTGRLDAVAVSQVRHCFAKIGHSVECPF